MSSPAPDAGRADAAFALWLTGLPASGKSTVTAALVEALAARGPAPEVLESDVVRRALTPAPTYSDDERALFYRALAWAGQLLVARGIPVIFDATANRRAYRAVAADAIARFAEIHVTTPLEVCAARDPKGIYARGMNDPDGRVPGVQVPYEPPDDPLVAADGRDDPQATAARVVAALAARGWLPGD